VAIIETVIALALIFGFARKVTYIFSALVALGIWSIAEGFGGPHSSTSTDIGSAVIYAVVAMSLLAMSFQCGLSRYSVDHYLERRLPWWHKVAEIARRAVHMIRTSSARGFHSSRRSCGHDRYHRTRIGFGRKPVGTRTHRYQRSGGLRRPTHKGV